MSALDKQIGGQHYKGFKIQPIQYITANNIPYIDFPVCENTAEQIFRYIQTNQI
jgi:hypothetical protein